MKIHNIFCLILILLINLALIFSIENDIEAKYTNKNYFAVIGITGEGKSFFVNTISGQNKFEVSSEGNSVTQKIQDVEFIFNNNSFVAIDTPGLDDSLYNDEKIKQLKSLIMDYPTIKCLLIVKKYNNFRISSSLQEAIKIFIESFPLENFWDHVIVINTWANPKDETFKEYCEKERQFFIDKIDKCRNLKDFMAEKKIKFPAHIKEYFIDTKQYNKDEKMKEIFTQIKEDILKNELMFKKVERSGIKESVKKSSKKDTYIVKKYRVITCTDFNGQKKEINETIDEYEEALSESNQIRTKTKKKFIEKDHIRFYDVLSLSLTWWFRSKYLFRIYESGIHKIGNEEIVGEEKYTEDIWE
jgi:hypothetical protein